MNKSISIIPIVFSLSFFLFSTPSFAEDVDIFAEYNADIRKSADAKTSSVYGAWGENMGSLIRSGKRDGVVITGSGQYADGMIRSDGVGNVNVGRGANVGPIINQTKIENATIVNNNRSRFP